MGWRAVFVFGSNRAGRHGAGAAKYAMLAYGAIYGQGEGRQGQSYGIPTKDADLNTLSLAEIEDGIHRFAAHAREHHDEVFILTPIGCGLAGYSVSDLWPIIHRIGLPSNVALHSSWVNDHPLRA